MKLRFRHAGFSSTILKWTALLLSVVLVGCTSLAGEPTYQDKGVAVNGYDIVAYFTEQQPVKGKAEYSSQYNDVQWLFSSELNQTIFERDPQYYVPQYGGYCAYGMSKGFVVDTEPSAFTILNNKLYLNYSLGVRETWLKDTAVYIERADKNWSKKIAK
ncbi:YHS domain-containing protein [Shewanella sp. KX20019]|uniref:YHS domain-containing (seleno)protein n=1 Tax=Shewanella sp. KX20019 TaxID=2803864 RepID=UPI00192559E4|nr:YHS domain-containing (seleno)protein [Shewanella sp. KX20019]QQX78796.1 YHS domain-containing protein [Shewanella sp. KX20019]